MTTRTTFVPVILAALLMLAACAPTTPAGDPPVSDGTTPPVGDDTTPLEPEGPAEPTLPTVRFDLDCDDIAATAELNALVTDLVTAQDPYVAYVSAGSDLPHLSHIETLGGLQCEWSNGVVHSESHGTPASYAGIQVSILAEAGGQWPRYVDYYGVTGDRQEYCNEVACGLEQFVNGYWLSVVVSSPDTPFVPGWFAVLSSMMTTLAPPAAAWDVPATTAPIADDCEGVIPVAEVSAALGTGNLTAEGPHGGWSQWASAQELTGGGSCSWSDSSGYRWVGGMTWLPGGAWAAQKVLAISSLPSAPSTLSVAGLGSTDTAHIRCSAAETECYVDLVIDGNWVQFSLHSGPEYLPLPAGVRASAGSLAAAIVASLS